MTRSTAASHESSKDTEEKSTKKQQPDDMEESNDLPVEGENVAVANSGDSGDNGGGARAGEKTHAEPEDGAEGDKGSRKGDGDAAEGDDAGELRTLFPDVTEDDKVLERAIDHVNELKTAVSQGEAQLAEMRERNKLLRQRAEEAIARQATEGDGKEGAADGDDASKAASGVEAGDATDTELRKKNAAALRELLDKKTSSGEEEAASGAPPPPEGKDAKNLDHLVPATNVEWKQDDALLRFQLYPEDLKDLPSRSIRNPGKPYPDRYYDGAKLLELSAKRNGGVEGLKRILSRLSMCYVADPLDPPSTRYLVFGMHKEDVLDKFRLAGGNVAVTTLAQAAKLTACFQEADAVVLLFAPKFTRGFKTWGTVASIPPSGGVTVEFEPDTFVGFRDVEPLYKDQIDAFHCDLQEIPPDLGALIVKHLEAAVARGRTSEFDGRGAAVAAAAPPRRRDDNRGYDRGYSGRGYDSGRGGRYRRDRSRSPDRYRDRRRSRSRSPERYRGGSHHRDYYRDRDRDRDRARDRDRSRGDRRRSRSPKRRASPPSDDSEDDAAREARKVIEKRRRAGHII